jgi:hypothetical protein
MQIGQLTFTIAESYGVSKKTPRKVPVAKSSVSQSAYTLDVRTEALSRLDQVRARIACGYYDRPEVLDALADRLLKIL